jgi:hypothetical protein
MPNVRYYFKLNSFSMQFYALRDIKAGEQLFYSYCEPDGNLAHRQAELAPYGFVCKCPACVNATPKLGKMEESERYAVSVESFKNCFLGEDDDEY